MSKENWDFAVVMFGQCCNVVPDNLVYRQTLGFLEVIADDAEDDLRYQLLANRDFTVFRNPQAHRGFIHRLRRFICRICVICGL